MAIFKKASDLHTEEVVMSNITNIIGKGTEIDGNVDTQGNIRIDGKVKGNIKAKAKVVLGKGSMVVGNILSINAELEGEVSGNIEVSETLVLKSSSVVRGDVKAKHAIVESGAKFAGQFLVGDISAKLNSNEFTEARPTSAKNKEQAQ